MTQKRMDDIELDIKALKTRVNIILMIGVASFILTVLKLLVPALAQPHTPSTNSNSVQIGADSKENPQREFLNSDEVGEREGVTSRTVISWIEQGRIEPQPTRNGRAWTIAAGYRILPQSAELTENKP